MSPDIKSIAELFNDDETWGGASEAFYAISETLSDEEKVDLMIRVFGSEALKSMTHKDVRTPVPAPYVISEEDPRPLQERSAGPLAGRDSWCLEDFKGTCCVKKSDSGIVFAFSLSGTDYFIPVKDMDHYVKSVQAPDDFKNYLEKVWKSAKLKLEKMGRL